MVYGEKHSKCFDQSIYHLLFPQVTAQTEEVIRCRIQQRNMATTVEKLQLCIPGTTDACVVI